MLVCGPEVRNGHWSGDRRQTTLDHRTTTASAIQEEQTWDTAPRSRPRHAPADTNNSSVGQAVFDLFLGSGTTMIAAETTGRAAFVIEIDPGYVDVAVKRWQDFTGKKAVLDGDGRTFEELAGERAVAGGGVPVLQGTDL